jgi:hypothetical protein
LLGLVVGVTTLVMLGFFGLLGALLGVVGYVWGSRGLGAVAMAVDGLQVAFFVASILLLARVGL